jgi:hypothetical protein
VYFCIFTGYLREMTGKYFYWKQAARNPLRLMYRHLFPLTGNQGLTGSIKQSLTRSTAEGNLAHGTQERF